MLTVKHYLDGVEYVVEAHEVDYHGPLADEATRDVRVVILPAGHDPVTLRGGRVTVLNDKGAEVAEYNLAHAVTVGDEPEGEAFRWPAVGEDGVAYAPASVSGHDFHDGLAFPRVDFALYEGVLRELADEGVAPV